MLRKLSKKNVTGSISISISTSTAACRPTSTILKTRNGYGIEIPPITSRAIERAQDAYRDLSLWERHGVVPEHTLNAFNELNVDTASENSIAIDSGCGTGLSTRLLASILPENTRLIGLDRSAVRLSKGINYHHRHYRHQHQDQQGDDQENAQIEIIRADMEHFWRLAVHNSWAPSVQYQFLFYPNPYPLHMKRRIYGRPAFPYVVALGGRIEVRASWAAYLEEFLAAYSELAKNHHHIDTFRATDIHPVLENNNDSIVVPISNFEKKFIDAEQPVYRLVIDTRPNADREACPFKMSDDKLYNINSNG